MVTGWSQNVKSALSHINQHPAPLDTQDSIQEAVGPKSGNWEASLLGKAFLSFKAFPMVLLLVRIF